MTSAHRAPSKAVDRLKKPVIRVLYYEVVPIYAADHHHLEPPKMVTVRFSTYSAVHRWLEFLESPLGMHIGGLL